MNFCDVPIYSIFHPRCTGVGAISCALVCWHVKFLKTFQHKFKYLSLGYFSITSSNIFSAGMFHSCQQFEENNLGEGDVVGWENYLLKGQQKHPTEGHIMRESKESFIEKNLSELDSNWCWLHSQSPNGSNTSLYILENFYTDTL